MALVSTTWSFTPIETLRLKIEYITKKYMQEIFDEKNNPKVNIYLSSKSAATVEDLEVFIDTVTIQNENKEIIQLQVLDKETHEFIGLCVIKKPNNGHPEISLWTKEGVRGKGYGKELVGGLLDRIKVNLQYEYIIYETFENNIGSIKIAEYFGGVKQPEVEAKANYYGQVLNHVQYRIY